MRKAAALALVASALLSGAHEDEDFAVEDVVVDAAGGRAGPAAAGGGLYTSGAREAGRKASEDRRRAAADVDEDDAFMRNITHFTELEAAEEFMMPTTAGAGARALGFFAQVHSAEHDVFLTVARQLWGSGEAAPALGRATIKRHTSGATVNLVPAIRVATVAGGALAPLLTHQYRIPDADDAEGVALRWAELHPERASEARPASRAMWEALLEAEALVLHAWVQAGALPAVSRLDTHTLEPLLAADALALLLLPPGANPALRAYYLRRAHAAAARFPSVVCEKGALPDGAHAQLWLPDLPRCNATDAAETVRFAHADGGRALAEPSTALGALAARADAKSLLAPAGGAARFVVLRRERSARGRGRRTWRVAEGNWEPGGSLTTDAMVELVREQLPWARKRAG